VLRGLGYWYFYGSGPLGPWTASVVLYTKWLWLVALSFFLPVLSFLAAVLVRWRHRGYFVVLVVVGVVLSVGAYPYTHPTAAGGLLKAFMSDTTAGLAMRSTDRATPLVVLGLAVLLGAGVTALWQRATWTGWATAALVAGMVVANNPALFNGDAEVDGSMTQPASLPGYELAAIDHLNATHKGTRVLAVPGNAFATYTWGDTEDTPQPALLTRPFVTREQQVMGSMATADTLYAVDSPIQTSTEDWSSLAPMARLLSAGDVLVEYDQDSAVLGGPKARTVAGALAAVPEGLSHERTYGTPGENVAKPTLDPQVLSATPRAPAPRPLATYTVTSPRPIVRAESDEGALIVDGDATGLETLAAQGLLDTTSAIYYAGTLDTRRGQLDRLAGAGATLVVTDTDRKQGFHWNGLQANTGYVEEASDDPQKTTPSDSPIELFPGAPVSAHTLGTFTGAADVSASSYGNPVTYAPEDRAYSAIDGNLRTAWETGTFSSDVDGQWWQVALRAPASADHVTLVQPVYGTTRRWITEVTLTFTGGHAVTARLGPGSRRPGGQLVTFSPRSFKTLRITIDATSSRKGKPVGFAEVAIPGVKVAEVDQLPTDLLDDLGAASLRDRLVISMTRARVSAYSTDRSDPQTTLSRSFTLPTARTFTLSGTATLSTHLTDGQIDRLVGVPGATGSGVVAYSSNRLTGDLAGAAASTADGNPDTSWQTGFGAKDVVGSWLEYDLPAPITFDHMTLRIDDDRRHSVPAAVRITARTAAGLHTTTRTVALPPVLRSTTAGTTATIPLHFAAVTGQRIRVTFTKVHEKRGTLASGKRTGVLPIGVAEIGIPGLRVPPAPSELPGTCRSNLLSIDGRPVTVRVAGSTAVALHDGQVSLQPCGADASGIHLAAGHHVVASTLATTPSGLGLDCASTGGCDGWNVDELTLDSAPGGAAEQPPADPATVATSTAAATRSLPPPVPGKAPVVTTLARSATSQRLKVAHVRAPFELVLGESIDAGWHAVAVPGTGATGHDVTLGPSELVDAFANGWQVTARDLRALGVSARGGDGGFTVDVTWAPQREVWAGIVLSAAAMALCLLLVAVPRRRRPGSSADKPEGATANLSTDRHAGQGPTVSLPWAAAAPSTPVGPAARLPWWGVAAASALTGAIAAAIAEPFVGLAVAGAVAAGLVVRPLRVLGAAAAVLLLAAAALVIVVGQAVHPAPGGGDWPASYNDAAALASAAVAFLGADVVVDYSRRLGRKRAG
jgi:arabinofuranan 3-O-arabinosyltransferase